MVKHFNKKKRCQQTVESIKYSDDDIFKLSFIPYTEECNINNMTDVPDIKKIKKTKQEIFDELKNIHINHVKECTFCNKSFDKIKFLRKHIISECNAIEIVKQDILNINNITINVITNNNISPPSLVSFDKNWDTSHLNYETKLQLFLSTIKYTKTLEYILKNDVNLNVLIDKDNEYGFTYNESVNLNKINKMKVSDIIDESILKIYNHLKDFSTEINLNDNFLINKEFLNIEKDNIEKKYKDFYDNKNTKKNVEIFVTNMFSNINEKTKDKFKSIGLTSEIDSEFSF